ncbi:MAG: hypothetical protein ABUT20_07200 [Bacteroidota bacterium]
MRSYTNASDAISDMHRDGFTNDFQLFGNDLLWIQEGFFIRAGEFAIIEYHKVNTPGSGHGEDLLVFGIFLPYHNIKGILLSHYNSYTQKTPPVLVKKLNEWEAVKANESVEIA